MREFTVHQKIVHNKILLRLNLSLLQKMNEFFNIITRISFLLIELNCPFRNTRTGALEN